MEYQYNSRNQCVRERKRVREDLFWIYRYEYDEAGRMVSALSFGETPQGIVPKGKTLFTYDGNGNCIRQRDVTGKVTEYRYDVCDRLAEVWDEGKRLASYAYQEDGRIREESHGPLRKAYTYDGEKNLTGLTLWSGDKLLADNRYRYGGNGNRTLKQQLRGETRYHFDPLNQLKRVDYYCPVYPGGHL